MFKLLFKFGKWKIVNNLPKDVQQCVIVAAPHTSNWDFIYGMGGLKEMKLKTRFTIKKEWLRFPFKKLMDSLGALPIDRTAIKTGGKKGSVDLIADLFKQHKQLYLMVTPEGTRAKMEKWKTGFYYIAQKANVPLALGFMDYKTRTCGIAKIIHLTNNFEIDMKEVMSFYKTITPKFPENFSVDLALA